MLVLGKEALNNGLETSLLLRLHDLYSCYLSDDNPYTGKLHM